MILLTCKPAPCPSTHPRSWTVPWPFQVLLFLPHSHLVSRPAALMFAREKVVTLLSLSSYSSNTLFFLCLWQAGCPPQGKGLCMTERTDVRRTLTEAPGAGIGLYQDIKLLGILFTVQSNLQEHSQGWLWALFGGIHELSPKYQLGTAPPMTSRFGSWSLQPAETFPSQKRAAGRGYVGHAREGHPAHDQGKAQLVP